MRSKSKRVSNRKMKGGGAAMWAGIILLALSLLLGGKWAITKGRSIERARNRAELREGLAHLEGARPPPPPPAGGL